MRVSIFFLVSSWLWVHVPAKAQERPFKQRMFRDITVTSPASITQGDTVIDFHLSMEPAPRTLLPDRPYWWFHQNKLKVTQGNYAGKLLHGPYQRFDQYGNLREAGSYENGLREGPWHVYYHTGQLQREELYEQGWRTGRFSEWDIRGNRTSTGFYHQNKLEGRVNYFDDQGKVIRSQKFREGKPVVARVRKVRQPTPRDTTATPKKERKQKAKRPSDEVEAAKTPEPVTGPQEKEVLREKRRKKQTKNADPPQTR